MPFADGVEQAIGLIADGMPVDWVALKSDADSDDDREFVKCLQIVDGVADLHRSTQDAGSQPDDSEETVARPIGATADEQSVVWGRYRLAQKVGEGGFGSVYRAWDPELEREIAIKILHQRVAGNGVRDRLLREGRALARVRHANVVAVFGVESHGDRVGLCMEFIQGETLDGVLRTHGTLNARETVLIGEDVGRALAAVHHAGFVHRDVKARNVMREKAGRIVLMDFGTGRETEYAARTGRLDIAGTPVYMAPEVLAGDSATASSDVYSVGVLLYHLVTGEYPVAGRSMDDVREAHAEGRRRLLSDRRPDLPLPFVQVVERALASDLSRRYATAGALVEALGAVSDALDGKHRLSRVPWPWRIATGLSGAVGALLGLGMLSSRVFNASLGRSEFASDTVWDWLLWGGRSCVGPAVLLLMCLASLGLVAAVRRIAIAASKRARRWDLVVRQRGSVVAHRLHLDDTPVLASCVLLLSASALIASWWWFSPLLGALFTDVSNAPEGSLRMLAPGLNGTLNDMKVNYRLTFSWVTIGSLLLWSLVARLAAKKRESLHWGVVAGAAAVIVLAFASLDYPFRLLNIWGNQFDAATWVDAATGQRAQCYILGERQEDALLFCPALPPPRNRVVSKATSTLERTGVHESIFARFAQSKGTR